MDTTQLTAPEKPQIKIPKSKKKHRWVMVLVVLAVLAALAFFFLIKPVMDASKQFTGALYTPNAAEYRDLTVSVSGTATVLPVDSYQVTTLVKGEISTAPFAEGEQVTKDSVLYTIDHGELEKTIARSELSLQRAQNGYDKLLRDLATAQSDKNKDVKDGDKDQVLYAKDGGVVEKLHVELGDTVMAGAAVAEILDRETMLLKVPFHKDAALGFTPGQTAAVTVDGTGETLTGTISEVAFLDQVGPGGALTRTVTIQVGNPGGLSDSSAATAQIGGVACAEKGTFAYGTKATLSAKKAGEISALYVAEGGTVQPGDAIYALKGSTVAETYDKQIRSLNDSIADAKLTIADSKLALQSARDQLESYEITSPISGTVIEKNFKEGDNLDATTSGYLAVIYDMSALTFDMSIDERYISQIKEGQEVRITAEALPGAEFTGRVRKININGTTSGGVTSYPVTVDIDSPGTLLPGMNVSAEIIVEEAKHVLSIPVSAVNRGDTVDLLPADAVTPDGAPDYSRTVSTPVTLGRNDKEYIEVLTGIHEGDTVVTKQSPTTMLDQMMAMSGMAGAGMGGAVVTGP